MNIPVVTIDGPTASGKGTIAKRLATHLRWHFLESGLLYRLLALYGEGLDQANEAAFAKAAEEMLIQFMPDGRVMLSGVEVSAQCHLETVGAKASLISAYPAVRKALFARQRAFLQAPGLVADGRDMGTVVFPEALLKIFLTASAEIRAERRYQQLKARGVNVTLRGLVNEIRERDKRDITRAVSPLIPAADAVVIESTHMTADQVFEQVLSLVQQRL